MRQQIRMSAHLVFEQRTLGKGSNTACLTQTLHSLCAGDTPGGFDPNELVTKGDLTEKIATTEATADDLKRED